LIVSARSRRASFDIGCSLFMGFDWLPRQDERIITLFLPLKQSYHWPL
jgi:hypothetical protein